MPARTRTHFELVKKSLHVVYDKLTHCSPIHPLQVFELVKNSLRAVYDRFEDASHDPPPIRLVIAEGEEDITIKVRGWLAGGWGGGPCWVLGG
jgi:hypothetical protein